MIGFSDVRVFLRSGIVGETLLVYSDDTFEVIYTGTNSWSFNPESKAFTCVTYYTIKETYNENEDDINDWTEQVLERMNNQIFENSENQ